MSWAALVLAAGRSSRMGPSHKLLELLQGKPLIRHAIDCAQDAGLAPLIMVTGYRADEVLQAAEASKIIEVRNPDYAQGLMSSLQAGLTMVPETCNGVVILLGDMPLIKPSIITALLAALAERPAAIAAVPVTGGEWGHPVVMRRSLFADVMTLSGDQGARVLLKARLDQVIRLEVDDPDILVDCDTPEALARVRQALER